jgi:two-component system sensor histidine kinase DesK
VSTAAAQVQPGGGTVTDVDNRLESAELRGLDERRRLLLSLGMLCYPFLAGAGVAQYTHGAGLVVGYLLLVGISACYLAIVVASMRSAWRAYWWLLTVMTALAVLVAPLAHETVLILTAVIVPAAAARVGGRTALALVGLGATACVVVPLMVSGWSTESAWYYAVAVAFTALLVHAFSRTATANRNCARPRRRWPSWPRRPSATGLPETCTTCSAIRSPPSP